MKGTPSSEVHGRDCEVESAGITNQASIACPCEAVHVLEQGKQRFDWGAGARDQLVPAHDRRAGRMPTIAPARDPIADAKSLEKGTSGITVVGLVGIHDALVAADQPVGGDAVIDVGSGKLHSPHDPAALVHGNMRLVAEEVLALLLRPSRVGIERVLHQLAGRPSESGGAGVVGGTGALTAARTSEASISVPRLSTKPDRSIWPVISAKARSANPLLASCSRNRQIVEWSGTGSVSESPRKWRNDSRSASASSSCGPDSP